MQKSSQRLLSLFMVIFIDTFGYFFVMLAISRLINSPHGLLPSATPKHRQWLYEITLMLSPLAFITLSPVAGRLSDRIGRKKTIGFCLLASLLGFVIPLIGIATKRVWPIMLGRFIAGAGTTSQPIAQAAITDFSQGKRKAFNLGLIGLSMTLAMVLGPLGAGYCQGNATPYWIGTALAVINLLLLLTTFTETHTPNTTPVALMQRLQLLTKPILCLLLTFLLGELVWSGYYQAAYLGFLKTEFSLTSSKVGVFMAYVGLWMCLGLTIVYHFWLKRSSARSIGLLSLIIFTASYIVLLSTNTILSHWLIIPFIAITFGTFYPSILHLISEHTPQHSQGWMLGVASQVLGLAWMLTAFSVNFSSHVILGLCSVLGFFALLIFYFGEYRGRAINSTE
jgi:MFS family permease